MRIGVLLAILFFGIRPAFAQQECTLRKDNDGVKVYLCDNERSAFKTIIVELEVPATLAQYSAKVLEVENYFQWQDRVTNQHILKQISKTELYYYSEVDVPWPVANRDYVFHLKLTQDPKTKVVEMSLSGIADYIPQKEGIIRVPYAESVLTLTPINATTLKVKYVLDIDPGGEVPAWLINMFAANTPWNTFNNFREQIIEQGNNRIEIDFIENFR